MIEDKILFVMIFDLIYICDFHFVFAIVEELGVTVQYEDIILFSISCFIIPVACSKDDFQMSAGRL